MSIYYQDDDVTLYHGDCREIDAWLAADVLVTDPPYGRAWRQGDTNSRRARVSNAHPGIANDRDVTARDDALSAWGSRPAVVLGDLLISPPTGTRQVLIYDKGSAAGYAGAMAGFRRNAEAIYLCGSGWPSGLGGRSCILTTGAKHVGNLSKQTGHPHAKPLDVMGQLVSIAPLGVIADSFAGSGSTLLAARNCGRSVIGVELDERYCEIAAKRLDQGVLFGGAA